MKTISVLVTGANGFVGKSLCAELFRQGFAIRTVVRSLNNHADVAEQVIVSSMDAETDWAVVIKDIDVVIHLAARVHIMNDKAENALAEFRQINVDGTLALTAQAAMAGVKRFIYISSIKVNGEFTKKQPFTEGDLPNPQDPYAISKFEAEKALRQIEKETGMEVVILRPPLIYGPGVKANFAALLKLVDKKLPLPLVSINNKRSLIYVGNFVDAIITCATHANAAGQTYLVSDGEDVSMPQLIKKIASALNKPNYLFPFPMIIMRLFAKIIGKTASVDRLTQSLVIDSSKIRQELDWKPPFTLEQGLKVTADWYRKSLEN